MRYANIKTFEELREVGTKIEDDLRIGYFNKPNTRGFQGSTSRNVSHISTMDEINVLDVLSAPQKLTKAFTPLDMSYTDAFQRLVKKGLLSNVGPTPDPADKPKYWKANEFCEYH
jgi:hypothetical protein